MGKVVKQWKTDGPEDKCLKKFIKQGKINQFTKPGFLQYEYPAMFGGFSVNVIRNHLNSMKRNHGLYLEGESDNDQHDENEQNQEAGDAEETPRRSKSDVSVLSGSALISHQNYPVIIKQFTCPITEYEKVLMVVTLPGGAQSPKVQLHDDGIVVMIKYAWPKPMYDVQDLFKKQLTSKEIQGYHPMLLCFKAGLAEVRKKIDVAPESIITLNLPLKVQTNVSSWTKWAIQRGDGTQTVIAVFTGYIKEYVKKESDERVEFV